MGIPPVSQVDFFQMLIVPLLQRGLLLRKLLFPAFLADKKQFVDRVKKQYICQRQNEKPEFQAVLRPYGAIISKGNPKIDQRVENGRITKDSGKCSRILYCVLRKQIFSPCSTNQHSM